MKSRFTAADHPWELIYRSEGKRDLDPFPRFAEVSRIFEANKCKTVLDLGCGAGRHAVALSKAGFFVTGLDISAAGLRLAQAALAARGLAADLVQSDFRVPLPFASHYFEAVFSTQVIHHARKAEVLGAIDEIWRVLEPGGLAFITVTAGIGDIDHEVIEPGTFVPTSGNECGLPHHVFTRDGLDLAFTAYIVGEISLRAEGKVWAVLAQRPGH